MGEYLKDNEVLTGKVGDIVIPIGENLQEGTSVDISIETSMEIENGEGIIGYEYLHGTNETVGGFQISGTISKTTEGDMIFALQYSWNDIMDPNFQYSTDQKKASIAKKIVVGLVIGVKIGYHQTICKYLGYIIGQINLRILK